MGGSNRRQCLQCGKLALSIATRCPSCGSEFPVPAVPERGGARPLKVSLTPRGLAVLFAVVAVLASTRLGRTGQLQEEQSASVPADSISTFSDVVSSTATTSPLYTARVAASAGESDPELRVARSWTNVRKSRSVSAALEAMLMPGDTILADSLNRGWYRVALEGEVLGYAHRSTLAAVE